MFERKKFKAAALEQLKGRWKIPVLATLLTCALIGILGMATTFHLRSRINAGLGDDGSFFGLYDVGSIVLKMYSIILGNVSCFNMISTAFAIIFAVAILSVCNTMLKENRAMHFSDFTNGLNQWWQAFRGGLWYFLWVFLWSLLFVIPGIVKSYSYSMMFFVMAEKPGISVRKAMQISKELTRGYKGDLFVLDLSFVGWAILASIPCMLGFIWLVPYMCMVKTNAYQYLKQTALDTNRVSLADFE